MDANQDNADLLQRALERHRSSLEHDASLQRLAPPTPEQERLIHGCRTSIECLAMACELFAARPCFAEADPPQNEGSSRSTALPSYRFTTFAELWARVEAFASGLRHLGLAGPEKRLGICGFGSLEWVVADLASMYLGAVSVPLQTTFPPADLRRVIQEAELSCIVCGLGELELIAAVLPSCPTIESIVVMGVREHDRGTIERFALAKQTIEEEHGKTPIVVLFNEVEDVGHKRGIVPRVTPIRAQAGGPDPLMTLMYTSGSTGSPKGAMFPESLWHSYWGDPRLGRYPAVPYVSVNYMPLNHMAGRLAIIHSIMFGGLTYFVRASDMSTLWDDIRAARPTSLMLIPRVSSMIYQHFQSERVKRGAARGLDSRDEPAWRTVEAEIMAEMRSSFLGDRLIYMTAGTAPTAPEVRSFIQRCFDAPLLDGYGATEVGAIAFEGRIVHNDILAWKIVSVPELGYRTTDEPFPRGELCVKSRRAIPGYYRNPEATRGLFDEEGFVQTGDIVEQRGPDEVAVIDRKKNVLKLAQGEFVSTTRLEELYAAGSAFIHQIYIYGTSVRSYLLAVIVPSRSAVKAHFESQGLEPDEAAIRALIRSELSRVATSSGAQGYEVPRDFLLESEPFTSENGLLTESNKPSRPRLRARYGERLDHLYAELERHQLEELYALSQQRNAGGPVAEKIKKAVEVTLGVRDVDLREANQSFLDLGGDSLSAVRLADVIKDVTGVVVPVGLLLDPTRGASAIVRYVEERLAGAADPRSLTFEQVHGVGATVVRADDLRLDRFLGPDDRRDMANALPISPLPRHARSVLLTGANGFLGRFLLLDLLERAPSAGGKVVAIVRAPTDAAARERLRASYRGSDPALEARFEALADDRLVVLQGDLIKLRMGLPDEVYEQLADDVDCIVHNGALVNHALSYAQLFEPNVLGTVELMRFAVHRRIKAMSFVSTVGVASGLTRTEPVREDEDGLSLSQERPIDSGYAVGYATSKWADEVLLRELSGRFGVPVDVFRCSMIMAHREYLGQVNTSDFLTRLLYGIVITGIAPRSFYAAGTGRPHFDGLPVDFVARSIAAIATEPRAGYATYHVVNARWDDEVSLDTLVDWIQSAGYPVTRIDDHERWYEELGARLQALPALQQQHSPLPILYQWSRPIPADREIRFDASHLRERLAEIEGNPVEIPPLDEELIHTYLEDLVALGLLEKPRR